MKNTIGATTNVEPLFGNAPRPIGGGGSSGTAQGPAPSVDNTRLVIERDQISGTFVYKSLDRATGEVVRQFPREDVLKMQAQGDYAAGDLIKTGA